MGRGLLGLILFSTSLYGQAVTGNEHFDQGRYSEAVAAYEKVPQAERTASVLNRLGVSYHMLNRLKEAESTYKAAVRLSEDESAAYNNLAALYYSQRKFSDAEGQLRRALQRDPENSVMRRNLRAIRYARENSKKARETGAQIEQSRPLLVEERQGESLQVVNLMPPKELEAATLRERRGDSFFARKLYEDAIVEYREAIKIDRYNASTINRLGLAYHQSQKINEAEQQYRQALRLNPYYLEAVNNLGTIEYVRKRYTRAMDQYNKALKIRPSSPTILLNIGACLFAMERYQEGYSVYQQALEIDPKAFDKTASFGTLIQTTHRNESMLNFYLAKVFAGNGDKDRAISYLYKAYEEGFKDVEKIKADPSFATLLEDERFLKLMETMTATPSPSR